MGPSATESRRLYKALDRIEELEEEIRQLREILSAQPALPAEWGLSPAQGRVLHAIARGNGTPVNKDRICAFVYGRQDYEQHPKIVDVWLCAIRRQGAKHGLTLITTHGVGIALSAADCARVRALLEPKPSAALAA